MDRFDYPIALRVADESNNRRRITLVGTNDEESGSQAANYLNLPKEK